VANYKGSVIRYSTKHGQAVPVPALLTGSLQWCLLLVISPMICKAAAKRAQAFLGTVSHPISRMLSASATAHQVARAPLE
jgi:hypothetical protein